MVADWVLITSILLLLLLSAYFASSETAMMKLNPYRLQSLAKQRHGGARRASKLLERKDRLLGVILIGNNLVNFTAVVVANTLFIRWFGAELGGVITTISTTFVFLIFAEIAPKSLAAERPEAIAFPSAYILVPLQALLKYVVAAVNFLGLFMVKPFTKGIDSGDTLSESELRTLFETSSNMPQARQEMFRSLLDLEEVRVLEVMVPREQMEAIDADLSFEEILERIKSFKHTRLPVYRQGKDNVIGILHMSDAYQQLIALEDAEHEWGQFLETPLFVPSHISIGRQLRNFHEKKYSFGVVVDEYGGVIGVISIEDIITTIIGNFMDASIHEERAALQMDEIKPGVYEVSGKTRIHELNNRANWQLPDDGPRTISGLVINLLRSLPTGKSSLKVNGYVIEVKEVEGNEIKTAFVRQFEEDELDKIEKEDSTTESNDRVKEV